ncbi:diaminopimelate decarboxylase family protein [Mesoterricola silvestris]|uniref:Diaminopimelate decarboxylase n=1 Tax=Mesoterricola silvestris TaxID=2927979 RepID=A0AA48GQ45_9BACT|nr:alanine racemase [Mesoterricola silvestris]BDU74054.1 hypothetical protein METEAL_32280 [Mesoterricola silvestris]
MTELLGRPAADWIAEQGLPLHLTSLPRIRENVRAFTRVFRDLYPRGAVRYAVKACAHPVLLAAIRAEGAGADVASPFEARMALQAGLDPRTLDLNGNCKEDELIREALASRMLIVADSAEELALVEATARAMGRRARVLLRLSGFHLGGVTGEAIFTAGPWSKFGIPLAEIPPLLENLGAYPSVRFLGFHTHIGSQITRVEPYLAVLGRMVELGRVLRDRTGACPVLNLGGGFPVNYLEEPAWDELRRRTAARDGFSWNLGLAGLDADGVWQGEAYHSPWPKEQMVEAILRGTVTVDGEALPVLRALESLDTPELLVEPGRAIAEDAGLTLCRVAHVRRAGGAHNLVTVEMGVLSHADAMLEGLPNRWDILEGPDDPEPFETFVAGNLCFSGDLLARFQTRLRRRPRRGDTLLIRDTGAYTAHFMASNANAYPRPPRLLVHGDGDVTVMKRRDRYEDLFA